MLSAIPEAKRARWWTIPGFRGKTKIDAKERDRWIASANFARMNIARLALGQPMVKPEDAGLGFDVAQYQVPEDYQREGTLAQQMGLTSSGGPRSANKSLGASIPKY